MSLTLRVWSEFLPPTELSRPEVVRLLASFRCGVLVQARAGSLDAALANALRALADGGVPDLGLWLLLESGAGYWPSERNVAAVLKLARQAVAWRSAARWLAIDLEPPLWQAGQNRLRAAHQNLDPRRFAAARATIRQVIDEAHAAGLRVLCAAHDYLAEDLWLGRPALQDLHEAPVLGLPWDSLSVMMYGSLMPGRPADRRRWMYDTARLLALLRPAASIGLTSSGALGDEPHYTCPEDLARDTAALKAAGVEDFAVYSLEGILNSASPEAWLRAIVEATPRQPAPSVWARRQRLLRRAQALLADAYRRLRRG